MSSSGSKGGRPPLRVFWLGLALALVCAGRAEAVPCPLGIDAGAECQISNAQVATGTVVFEKTLHILAGGSVTTLDASGFTLSIINQGDFIMDSGAVVSGDQPGCNQAAPVTILLDGGDVDLKPGSEVHSNSCQGGFIQIKTLPPGAIDIDGVVESVGSQSGASSGRPGGGPITIVAGCRLTISDDGYVSSRGRDPGADLVHLEGCVVTINGRVESTAPGHGIPSKPPTSCDDVAPAAGSPPRRNPVTRSGKPSNSTGCVEIWSGTTVTIDATGSHKGEVNADIGYSGGSQGRGWIEIFANGDIVIKDGPGNDRTFNIGSATKKTTFAVHANGGLAQQNDDGGLIWIKTTGGSVTGSGDAVQADATTSGSDGGEIHIEAFLNVTLDQGAVFARGDFVQSGGYGVGGKIGTDAEPVRAFQGTLSWQNGVGDVRPTGTDDVAPKLPATSRGEIWLQDCTAGAINRAGTIFPDNGAPATTPTEKADACAALPADFLPAYVQLPPGTCLDACGPVNPRKRGVKWNDLNGDGIRDPGEFGLPGWTILAFQGGVQVASAVTAGDGSYEFTLPPGTYTFCEVLQLNWTQTFPKLPSADPTVASCAGLPGGVAAVGYTVTLASNQVDEGNDFGNTNPTQPDCPEDQNATLTRAVDAGGGNHGVPGYPTVQAAYDAATGPNEVIGIFSNTTENVVLGGTKSLEITQCTTAAVTAADSAQPVWNITTTGVLTIIGPDAVGGTVGWRIATGGHTISGVRASGASQYGMQIIGSGNTVSFNALTGNTVGLRIEGDGNDVRGGTVSGSAGNGVELAAGASGNTFRTANVRQNGGHGIVVAGSGNTVRDNSRVDSNTLNGILVSGGSNLVKNNGAGSDAGKGNGLDGIHVSGGSNTLQANKTNANGAAGVHVAPTGAGTALKGNLSNQTVSGGSKENGGPEYRLEVGAIDQGGNRADTLLIPSAAKCPTFPAAGDCGD